MDLLNIGARLGTVSDAEIFNYTRMLRVLVSFFLVGSQLDLLSHEISLERLCVTAKNQVDFICGYHFDCKDHNTVWKNGRWR